MSLRWKIALALALIASAATFLSGAANYRTTRDQLYRELDRSLTVVDARLTGRSELPERGPFAGFDAQVVRRDGVVVQSTLARPLPVTDDDLRLVGERGRSVVRTVRVGDESYRVRTVGLERSVLQIARSLEETDRVLRALRTRTLLWTLLVVGASIVAGLWIAGRVTASLRRLTTAAEHVEATGRLDVDVGEDGPDEVGRLGAAFDRMLAALRRSRDDQQRLVQDAGHELRTPLTSLRTNLDALQRYPDMGPDDRDAILADLRAETHALSELVDEIVTAASGAHADEPLEPVDLAELATETAERSARRTSREIVVEGVPSPVVGRRGSLQRAISCLLDNACKFDDSGGRIVVEVTPGTVVVTDHGPGIPAGELERVFDRFHRSPSAQALPGSGLGLAIVRDIARRHGGDAFAANGADGGARVGFRVATMPPPSSDPPT